jgi:hypothetical protein
MDQFYFESGYLDDKYFVGEYYAEATLSAQSNIVCMISHLYGVDISAFTNASLSTNAVVISSGSATLSSQALITNFSGNLYALRSASLSSEFTQSVSANRLREPQIALSSQFTITAVASINSAVEASGNWTTSATLSITPILYKDMSADMYVDAVMDPDGVQRIRSVDSTQSVAFTQTTVNSRIRNFDSFQLRVR